MTTRSQVIQEARRRGLLANGVGSVIDEARRRGIIADDEDEELGLAASLPPQPSIRSTIEQAGVTDTGALTGQDVPTPDPGPSFSELGERAVELGKRAVPSIRPALIAGAGAVGFVAGTPGGPLAMIAGAGLAGMGAAQLIDKAGDVAQAIDPDIGRLPGSPEGTIPQLTSAFTEGAIEAATGALGPAVAPIKSVLAPVAGKLFGVVGDASRQLAALAERQGISLSAVDVGNKFARGFAKVLGIFPFTGTPLRTARTAKEGQIKKRLGSILNELAPTAHMAADLGVDMAKVAKGSFKKFRELASDRYETYKTAVRAQGAIIPTAERKEAIQKFVDEFRLGKIPLTAAADGEQQILKGGVNKKFEAFLTDSLLIPDKLTVDQMIDLDQRFASFIDELKPNAQTVLRVSKIKLAGEVDFDNLDLSNISKEVGDELIRLKDDAKNFFANGSIIFETPTAGKIARTDKNAFRAGPERPGSINEDQLFKPLLDADSPKAMRDLRELVGPVKFKQVVRRRIENAWEDAFDVVKREGEDFSEFQPQKFIDKLGLVKGAKDRSASVVEMLKGTGITITDLKEFGEAARVMKLSDPSAFIVRRITLGGLGAASAAFGVGGAAFAGGATGGAAAAVVIAVITRNFSKLLASPKALKAMTRAMNPDLSDTTRRIIALRINRALNKTGDNTQQSN